MTLNESALRKTILLLLCTAIMITCIGNAVADDVSTDQSSSPLAAGIQYQSGTVNVDPGSVDYSLSQQQYASILSGDGTITQDQYGFSTTKSNGPVTVTKVKEVAVQNVDLDNTATGSTDSNGPTTVNKNKIKCKISDGSSGSCSLDQLSQPVTSSEDFYQKEVAVLKIKQTPKNTVVTIKLKQK